MIYLDHRLAVIGFIGFIIVVIIIVINIVLIIIIIIIIIIINKKTPSENRLWHNIFFVLLVLYFAYYLFSKILYFLIKG